MDAALSCSVSYLFKSLQLEYHRFMIVTVNIQYRIRLIHSNLLTYIFIREFV